MVLQSGLFPSGFPIKTFYTPLLSSIRATYPPISLFSIQLLLLLRNIFTKDFNNKTNYRYNEFEMKPLKSILHHIPIEHSNIPQEILLGFITLNLRCGC